MSKQPDTAIETLGNILVAAETELRLRAALNEELVAALEALKEAAYGIRDSGDQDDAHRNFAAAVAAANYLIAKARGK